MRAIQMKAYLNQQQEIKHQEEVIDKVKILQPGEVHQAGGKPGKDAG